MPSTDYTYVEQSRRRGTVLALVLSIAMLAFAMSHDAPVFLMSPVIIALLMLGWMVAVNRRSGLSLTGAQLSMFAGRWEQVVPTGLIKSVKVVRWSEGAPTITLRIEGSPSVDVPAYCFGSSDQLLGALASRGIPVIERGRSTGRSH